MTFYKPVMNLRVIPQCNSALQQVSSSIYSAFQGIHFISSLKAQHQYCNCSTHLFAELPITEDALLLHLSALPFIQSVPLFCLHESVTPSSMTAKWKNKSCYRTGTWPLCQKLQPLQHSDQHKPKVLPKVKNSITTSAQSGILQ